MRRLAAVLAATPWPEQVVYLLTSLVLIFSLWMLLWPVDAHYEGFSQPCGVPLAHTFLKDAQPTTVDEADQWAAIEARKPALLRILEAGCPIERHHRVVRGLETLGVAVIGGVMLLLVAVAVSAHLPKL